MKRCIDHKYWMSEDSNVIIIIISGQGSAREETSTVLIGLSRRLSSSRSSSLSLSLSTAELVWLSPPDKEGGLDAPELDDTDEG